MIIEVKDVTKSYDGREVLKNFSLNIEDEHVYVVTGEKGCGKTTLLRLVLVFFFISPPPNSRISISVPNSFSLLFMLAINERILILIAPKLFISSILINVYILP